MYRVYRRRFLQLHNRWKALDEIYKIESNSAESNPAFDPPAKTCFLQYLRPRSCCVCCTTECAAGTTLSGRSRRRVDLHRSSRELGERRALVEIDAESALGGVEAPIRLVAAVHRPPPPRSLSNFEGTVLGCINEEV